MAVRAMMQNIITVNNVPGSDQAHVSFEVFYKDTVSEETTGNVQLSGIFDFSKTQTQRREEIKQVIINWATDNGFPGLNGDGVFIFDWV